MKLYHTTNIQVLDAILQEGINPSKSQGKRPLIWLHTKSKIYWAILHVQKKRKVSLDEVVIIEVTISKKHLKRAWKGIWTSPLLVGPTRFMRVLRADSFGDSPVPESEK